MLLIRLDSGERLVDDYRSAIGNEWPGEREVSVPVFLAREADLVVAGAFRFDVTVLAG